MRELKSQQRNAKGQRAGNMATEEADSGAGVAHTPCLMSTPPFPTLRGYLQ